MRACTSYVHNRDGYTYSLVEVGIVVVLLTGCAAQGPHVVSLPWRWYTKLLIVVPALALGHFIWQSSTGSWSLSVAEIACRTLAVRPRPLPLPRAGSRRYDILWTSYYYARAVALSSWQEANLNCCWSRSQILGSSCVTAWNHHE